MRVGQSGFRQAAMKGAFKSYLFNGFVRTASHLPYVVPPIAIGTYALRFSISSENTECFVCVVDVRVRDLLVGEADGCVDVEQGCACGAVGAWGRA